MKTSLLWSIQFRGVTSYLFGTMHTGSYALLSFDKLVKPLILRCSIYAAEMDLSEFDQDAYQDAIVLPNFDLMELMGVKKFSKCRISFLRHFGVDLQDYRSTHPFIAISTLSQKLLSPQGGISLDQRLFTAAKDLGLQCTGLESFDQQLDLFRKIPVASQMQMLYTIARNPSKLRSQLQKLMTHYLDQDPLALYHCTKRQLGGLRRVMLHERNKTMVGHLLKLHADSTGVFAAVGAAHLLGGKGMVRYLKNAGALVKPIHLM